MESIYNILNQMGARFESDLVHKKGNHYQTEDGQSILKTPSARATNDPIPSKLHRSDKTLAVYEEIMMCAHPLLGDPNLYIESGYLWQNVHHLGGTIVNGVLLKVTDRKLNYVFYVVIDLDGNLIVQKGEL